jgi:hypothetical protein
MMHDWTLVSILMNWIESTVTMNFRVHGIEKPVIIAQGITELIVPHREEWGRSVSVNEVLGPTKLTNSNYKLVLEMQSGDLIQLEARSFVMSEGVSLPRSPAVDS